MQAQRPCDTVDESSVGDGAGDDMAKVELDEVDVGEDGATVEVANFDEDGEYHGNEEEEGGEEGEEAAVTGQFFK